ncbi:UNVERIFIED_CONTAM: hypothetical protein GTU68_043968 [Idotea baltica]|nr:hypothetical protein [Idotea baltica]
MTATTKKKYVVKEVMEDYSLPTQTQSILKIVKSRGNNLHQVVTSTGEEFLASMPPKFRKHIWVKRGDYVITEPIPEGRKVRAEIVRILMKGQIKYYMEEKVWPEGFVEKIDSTEEDLMPDTRSSDEGEEEYESEDDTFLICNPNRLPAQDCDSDTSSSSEEDSCSYAESEEEKDEVSDIKNSEDSKEWK